MSARITEAMVEAGARASATRHYMERFRAPPDNPQVRMNVDANWYLFADEARTVLTAVLSTEPGEAYPFEHCAKEAEAQAELVEKMRGVYPGDPHGALGRDANKLRRLAKSIRQLRPAAPLPEDTHHGR